MALWNDKRTPAGVVTDSTTGRSGPMDRAHEWMKGRAGRTPVSDADHAVLDAAWHKSFADLKAAGVEHDADHPVAAAYRDASNAVNHANRSRDYGIATGRIKQQLTPHTSVDKPARPTRTQAAHNYMKNAAEAAASGKTKPAKVNRQRKAFKK